MSDTTAREHWIRILQPALAPDPERPGFQLVKGKHGARSVRVSPDVAKSDITIGSGTDERCRIGLDDRYFLIIQDRNSPPWIGHRYIPWSRLRVVHVLGDAGE